MLQSDISDYSDAYIAVKRTIAIADLNNDGYEKKLAFKNNALFISYILKVKNTLIDNTEV